MSQVFGRPPENSVPLGLEKPIDPIVPKIWPCGMHGEKNCRICGPTNRGHGHVFVRPDGVKARCGGPALCKACAKDLAEWNRLLGIANPGTMLVSGEPVSPAAVMGDYLASGSTPMILRCPICGGRHIDEPNPAIGWTNPPHKTHLCNHCGHLWRPQEYPTVGVSDEDWLVFMRSLTDDDWKEALKLTKDMIPEQAVLISELDADGFQKIGTQMPLYARFFTEPADSVDHIRLWYVDESKNIAQGDSIAWTTFLTNVLTCMKVSDSRIKEVIALIKLPAAEDLRREAQVFRDPAI